jgi:site-specific recombinase XerD
MIIELIQDDPDPKQYILPTDGSVPAPNDTSPALVYLASLASANSRRTMRTRLDIIAGVLSYDNAIQCPWEKLRYQHTQAIRSALAGKYAPAAANLTLAALKGVLKECWRLGLMTVEEMTRACDLKPVRGSRVKKGRALAGEELAALIAVCDETIAGVRDQALLSVLYGCGLRREEAAGLDLADYDEGEGSLLVRGMGNKERLAYLNEETGKHLGNWLDLRGREIGPLFCPCNKAGRVVMRRLSGQAVYDILKRRAAEAGIKNVSPHDLRRTYAGDLLDAGVDLSTVQQMMGHASPSTTAGYDRRGEAAKRKAANLLKLPG